LLVLLLAATPWMVTADARNEAGLLLITVPTPGAATPGFQAKLQDGLHHRIRYTLTLRPEGRDTVVLTEILNTEVMWDLFDDVFVIVHSEGGKARRSRVKTAERVVAALERPRFKTAQPVNALGSARYVVDVSVEVNPVSEEVLNRTRQMLAPPPSDGDGSATRGFLGGVVRMFVNEENASGGTVVLLYQSHPLVVQGGAP
jgi:hypothetical protein